MKRLIVLAVAGVILAGSGVAYLAWTRRPEHALHQIQRAVKDHDVALFRKHVDIDGVTSRLIDELMAEFMQNAATTGSGTGFGEALGVGLIQLMKPRLTEVMREQIVRAVEAGTFEGDDTEQEVSLADLSRQTGVRSEGFSGIRYVRRSGKIANVGLGFQSKELGTDLVLEIKLRDLGGYWQVAELSNIAALMDSVEKRQSVSAASGSPRRYTWDDGGKEHVSVVEEQR